MAGRLRVTCRFLACGTWMRNLPGRGCRSTRPLVRSGRKDGRLLRDDCQTAAGETLPPFDVLNWRCCLVCSHFTLASGAPTPFAAAARKTEWRLGNAAREGYLDSCAAG